MMILLTVFLAATTQDAPPTPPGEEAVAPYRVAPSNAGAQPFSGERMARDFGGQAGIRRIVDSFVAANFADPHIGEIFRNQDAVRLRRVIFEQFCYILNAGCRYTGRDMRTAHTNMGVQQADMNRLVENLQRAMTAERVPFVAQNRFLAKLAPMRGEVVQR
ncbi:group I truncated hemoglobin [Sphingomonas phyllosphaerae]|uniref:group I truncated hemoglobin n=1 Tax=Sphingomonas phyllosphaerae TaxID=257003 RepID=UPI0024137954|nr:group 1 truncated hemoglobin [Sphingomonas phyllosphaerae]